MLRTMTPGGRSSFCALAATSMPLNLGMPMSRMTMSGRSSSMSRTASSPSAASPTTERSASSIRLLSPRRTMPWSSASSTRKRHLRYPRGHRQLDGEGRTVSRWAAHGHGAMELFDAFLDAPQTQTIGTSRGIETDPIVGHRYVEPILVADDAHSDRPRLRVPDAIGEPLLDGSIDTGPVAVGERIDIAIDRQVDVGVVPVGEVAHVPFQRGSQAEVIQHARTQAERQIADGAEHAVNQFLALGHRRADAGVGRRPLTLDSPELHPQRREDLRHVVVELP